MRRLRKNIPHAFTLGNLCLGVLAIQHILQGNNTPPTVHYFVMIAALFDLLDGLLARALKVTSSLGGQLDSLADLITFGVLPMFIYAQWVEDTPLRYLLLLVPICSAIRLAIFNESDDQGGSFKGISTTAHGIFVAFLPILFYENQNHFMAFEINSYIITTIAVFFSFLMVSKLRMISLKFSNTKFSDNWERYLLIFSVVGLVAWLGVRAAPFAMLVYILLSVYSHLKWAKRTKTKS